MPYLPVRSCDMEHRWGERVNLDIPVQLLGPARILQAGRMKNFSISGALVETEESPSLMTGITLIIGDMERRLQQPRALLGYVVRHLPAGFAMCWWNLAPVTVAHLLT